MSSQPNETVREDIANAIQLLRIAKESVVWDRDPDGVEIGWADWQPVAEALARLESALLKSDVAALGYGRRAGDEAVIRAYRDGGFTPGAAAVPFDAEQWARDTRPLDAAIGAPEDRAMLGQEIPGE